MDSQQATKILSDIERVVTALFVQHTPAYLVYHNINHTRTVVARVIEIAENYDLGEDDRFVLLAAAWFHDTGQMFVTPEWHEAESVKIANSFFYEQVRLSVNLIAAIDHCILATKMPQHPLTLVEEILCDADLYHLGTETFMTIDSLVKEESKLRGLPVDHWDQGTIKLMETHHFHTTYCKEKLKQEKEKNLLLLKERQK